MSGVVLNNELVVAVGDEECIVPLDCKELVVAVYDKELLVDVDCEELVVAVGSDNLVVLLVTMSW